MKSLLVVLMLFVAGCVSTDYGTSATTVKTTVPATVLTTIQSTAPSAPDVKISFVDIPASVKPNSKFAVKWKIESNQKKNITHTAVHYGNKSVQGNLSIDVTPVNAGYSDLTAISGSSRIPNEFSVAVFTQNKSTIYLRAHVVVDNKNYWTEEKTLKVE